MSNGWWGFSMPRMDQLWGAVTDYASALKFCEAIKPLRGRGGDDWRPIGRRSHKNVKQVCRTPGGDVIFRLYDTEAVTWHPDNTVTLITYPTRSTSSFILNLAPVCCNVVDGTAVTSWRIEPVTVWYERKMWRVPNGEPVRFTAFGRPVDPDALVPFEWLVLDKDKVSAVRKQYRTADFVRWVRAYEGLGGDHQREVGNYDTIAALLEAGEFLEAYNIFGLQLGGQWVAGQGWVSSPARLNQTELARFKAWLYVQHGATKAESRRSITQGQYYSAVRRNRYAKV